MPSLYQAIKIEPRQHTYIFIGFTDEELGLIGSSFYARQMTREQVAATDAMINLDTLGLASTNVWVSRSSQELVRALAHAAALINSPLTGINFERVGSTDSESFARRKIPQPQGFALNLRATIGGGQLPGPGNGALSLLCANLPRQYTSRSRPTTTRPG